MSTTLVGKKRLVSLKTPLDFSSSLLIQLWTNCNELALGIRTEPEEPDNHAKNEPDSFKGQSAENARYADNFRYGTIGYRHIRKLLQVLQPGPGDVFYDIGSGKGRILCVAAQRPVRKCVGVELFEPLCKIAQRNANSLRGRKAPIEIHCGDATVVDLSEGTIFFMFNPFGPQSLRHTLENIRRSLARNPRKVKVVYYNSQYQSVIETMDWLAKTHDFEKFGRHRVTIWENRNSRIGGGSPATKGYAEFPIVNWAEQHTDNSQGAIQSRQAPS